MLGNVSSSGLAGERRIVTVLFCDLKGSTALAESLDPEAWAELVDGAFRALRGPIDRYEGTDQGDAALETRIVRESADSRELIARSLLARGLRDAFLRDDRSPLPAPESAPIG